MIKFIFYLYELKIDFMVLGIFILYKLLLLGLLI